MNERIKELDKQCWNTQTNHLDSNLFAELIVRECIELVRFNSKGAGEAIEEYFGVKK